MYYVNLNGKLNYEIDSIKKYQGFHIFRCEFGECFLFFSQKKSPVLTNNIPHVFNTNQVFVSDIVTGYMFVKFSLSIFQIDSNIVRVIISNTNYFWFMNKIQSSILSLQREEKKFSLMHQLTTRCPKLCFVYFSNPAKSFIRGTTWTRKNTSSADFQVIAIQW